MYQAIDIHTCYQYRYTHTRVISIDIHPHVISIVLVETDFSQISGFYFFNATEKLITVQYYLIYHNYNLFTYINYPEL
jgi:hypothetical protein